MTKLKKVLFRTKEEAEAQTGYFRVSCLMITRDLGSKISGYISEKGLFTYSLPNQRKTCRNTYTLNFTLRQYDESANHKVYLSTPGAMGYYLGKDNEAIEELKKRSPTIEQMYFWIVQKYPDDLLWMDYHNIKPSLATARRFGEPPATKA